MRTYGAAPKAECFVSFLIAANVFVITATKRLMSQKLRTMTQMMKKKHDTKYSESIMLYMSGVHCAYTSLAESVCRARGRRNTHAIRRRHDRDLQRRIVYGVKALDVAVGVVIGFLADMLNGRRRIAGAFAHTRHICPRGHT